MRDLEKKKEWCRKNYREDPELHKKRTREWEKEHPDKRGEYTTNYRAKPIYKIKRIDQQARTRIRTKIRNLYGIDEGNKIINSLSKEELLVLCEKTKYKFRGAKPIIEEFIKKDPV